MSKVWLPVQNNGDKKMVKEKVVKIELHFSDEDFDLSKITKEYVEDVLESRGILDVTKYRIEVEEVND